MRAITQEEIKNMVDTLKTYYPDIDNSDESKNKWTTILFGYDYDRMTDAFQLFVKEVVEVKPWQNHIAMFNDYYKKTQPTVVYDNVKLDPSDTPKIKVTKEMNSLKDDTVAFKLYMILRKYGNLQNDSFAIKYPENIVGYNRHRAELLADVREARLQGVDPLDLDKYEEVAHIARADFKDPDYEVALKWQWDELPKNHIKA